MQYQPAGSNFYDELFGFLSTWEGVRRAPYDAGDSVITIGVGYNLTTGPSELRTGVLVQLGINVNALTNSTDPSALN